MDHDLAAFAHKSPIEELIEQDIARSLMLNASSMVKPIRHWVIKNNGNVAGCNEDGLELISFTPEVFRKLYHLKAVEVDASV